MEHRPITPRRAILSVWDKRGLKGLAQELEGLGVELIATHGTAQYLRGYGVGVREVSDYTGYPELLGGRVKTLHPKIFAGILATNQSPDVELIDLVVVNLYPFQEAVMDGRPESEVLELIDIGGVSLLRAGAKNYHRVAVVASPDSYQELIEELRHSGGGVSFETRRRLARLALEEISWHDLIIAEYFSKDEPRGFPQRLVLGYQLSIPLSYGENPHQRGRFYVPPFFPLPIELRQGNVLSYNNLLDIDTAVGLLSEFSSPVVCILKHGAPCGVGRGGSLIEAYERAYGCDPKSAWGGVVGFNRPLDKETARALAERFFEVACAPGFEPEALEVLRSKGRLRLVKFNPLPEYPHLRSALGGLLYQERDSPSEDPTRWEVVTRRRPSPEELSALEFAWRVCKWVKSNGAVLANPYGTVGIGGGQPARVDAVELALRRAGDRAKGSVIASDGFFPFRDSVDLAAQAGVVGVVQPGGSIRDGEVIKACDEYGISMVFTRTRHFRH